MSALQEKAQQLLAQGVGDGDACFHENQLEAIIALVEQRQRLLVVQRTGWGKSAVYFIATRLLRDAGGGPTLIVSPLIALMRNQIESAEKFGIRLMTLNSANTPEENKAAEQAIAAGELDALIISPEKLASESFVEEFLMPMANRVGMMVVDEAHCISDWGHDFRPDYKRIKGILNYLPQGLPILATTATANQRVIDDVAAQLGDAQVLRGKLTRASIQLQSIPFARRSQRLAWLADTLPKIPGTGIVYVSTTRDADLVARWLESRGIKAKSYYSGLRGVNSKEEKQERRRREADLMHNRIKALVATSALGMGYDKPDLSFVIHFQSPGSVISYYQQVGRAGRGLDSAHGVLLSGVEDEDIQQYFIKGAFPSENLVQEILSQLEQADGGMKRYALERSSNQRRGKIEAALKFLCAESPAPVVKTESTYERTLLEYELPVDLIRRVTARKQEEWSEIKEYLRHDECLMQFLAKALDDEAPPCGRCMNCDPDRSLSGEYCEETGKAAAEFLENVFIPIEPRKLTVKGAFPQYDLPYNLGDLCHETGRALSYWGEAGWGEIAMAGKKKGRFDPQLVDASAKLIRERWEPAPDPRPTWLACVPSKQNPHLVEPFAKGLAQKLGIPFVDVFRKIRANRQQKEMENTYHRCHNLDGVFALTGEVPSGPVFLVDDAVDSGWTFAVLAALLRQSGSGPVYPFAVVSTATSS